jgi:hypothetical protein
MARTRMQLAAVVAAMTILAVPTVASAAVRPAVFRTPVPGLGSLSGVACPTASACVSVGADDNFNGKSAVINAATGAAKVWSGDVANAPMNAVACASKKSCVAVADDTVASVAVSSGAMKVTATPKPPASGIVALGAIACAGTKACYAVGFEGTEAASTATVVHLSPAGKLLATKKNSGKGIAAIACPSATLCLMGENYSTGLVIQLLNNGSFGTSHPMPANTYIQAISCFKASLCYALGGNGTASPEVTDELFPLNPATGAVGTMAKIGGGFHGTSLSCLSASTCLAAGFTEPGSTAKDAVVAVVNGKPGTPKNYPGSDFGFASVACASASRCYAVGSSSSGAVVVKVKS